MKFLALVVKPIKTEQTDRHKKQTDIQTDIIQMFTFSHTKVVKKSG